MPEIEPGPSSTKSYCFIGETNHKINWRDQLPVLFLYMKYNSQKATVIHFLEKAKLIDLNLFERCIYFQNSFSTEKLYMFHAFAGASSEA